MAKMVEMKLAQLYYVILFHIWTVLSESWDSNCDFRLSVTLELNCDLMSIKRVAGILTLLLLDFTIEVKSEKALIVQGAESGWILEASLVGV